MSPRINFRLAPSGLQWIEDLQVLPGLEDADKSDIIRAALVVARRHEPELIETIKEQM
jgi:hypothetical protein